MSSTPSPAPSRPAPSGSTATTCAAGGEGGGARFFRRGSPGPGRPGCGCFRRACLKLWGLGLVGRAGGGRAGGCLVTEVLLQLLLLGGSHVGSMSAAVGRLLRQWASAPCLQAALRTLAPQTRALGPQLATPLPRHAPASGPALPSSIPSVTDPRNIPLTRRSTTRPCPLAATRCQAWAATRASTVSAVEKREDHASLAATCRALKAPFFVERFSALSAQRLPHACAWAQGG